MVRMLMTVLAGVGLALGTAGVATADDYMFLDEVRQKVSAPISAEQALKLGRVACDAIRDGVNSGLSPEFYQFSAHVVRGSWRGFR